MKLKFLNVTSKLFHLWNTHILINSFHLDIMLVKLKCETDGTYLLCVIKENKMLDPLGQAWQTPGRPSVNKWHLCGPLYTELKISVKCNNQFIFGPLNHVTQVLQFQQMVQHQFSIETWTIWLDLRTKIYFPYFATTLTVVQIQNKLNLTKGKTEFHNSLLQNNARKLAHCWLNCNCKIIWEHCHFSSYN